MNWVHGSLGLLGGWMFSVAAQAAGTAVVLTNPSGEINNGVDRVAVNDPSVPGWSAVGNGQLINDRTLAGNGRWRISLEDGVTVFQISGQAIETGAAYSLRFDASPFSGAPPSITATLVADEEGTRTPLVSKTFSFASTSVDSWEHFQLLTAPGDLDAHAGKLLGVEFSGPVSGGSRFLSFDDVRLTAFSGALTSTSETFTWTHEPDRTWLGEAWWGNRLQDWQVESGRAVCIRNSSSWPMRTAHVLTHRVGEAPGNFGLSARLENLAGANAEAVGGFLLGAGQDLNYRGAALVHHSPGKEGGLAVGVDGLGRAVIRDNAKSGWPVVARSAAPASFSGEARVAVSAVFVSGAYDLTVEVRHATTDAVLSTITESGLSPDRLLGNVAMASHPGTTSGYARFGFSEVQISGTKIDTFPGREVGPILCATHTLSEGVMSMNAQLFPLTSAECPSVALQVDTNGSWQTVATAPVDDGPMLAQFRLSAWDDAVDTPY